MKTRPFAALVVALVVLVLAGEAMALRPAVRKGVTIRGGALVRRAEEEDAADVVASESEDAEGEDESEFSLIQVSTFLHAHDSLDAALADAPAAAAAAAPAAAAVKPAVAPAPSKPSVDDKTQIHGKIKLNGQNFKTDCSCTEETESHMRFAKNESCVTPPSKFRVRQEAFNRKMGLSAAQLKQLLGRPKDATFVKISEVSFGTTDPRETEPVIATPGGDFGEFLLGLAEYEALTKRSFTATEVQRTLAAWLDWAPRGSRPMTLHTDEASTLHLQQNLHFNGQKGKVVALDVESPKQEYEEELLKDLPNSKNQGDYYLKAVLDDPPRFYVRRELPSHLVQSFFRILWDKKTLSSDGAPLHTKVRLNMLQGTPQPKAWINFRASHACERQHIAPLFRPFPVTTAKRGSVAASSVIVNHPEAAQVVRKRMAKFFALFNPMLSEAALLAKLNHRGATYMEIAAEVLGSEVPYYTVTME